MCEEYKNMQKHLLFITRVETENMPYFDSLRGIMAVWIEPENTAYLTFYYDSEATEDQLEEFSIVSTEIIAHCNNAMLNEKFIRWDYPKPLPKNDFWAYRKIEK